MVKNQKRVNTNKEYFAWCKKIAEYHSETDLISHFRTHTDRHFNRHKGEGKVGFAVWMIGVFNFINIFKEKFRVSTDDMLFQLCVYLKQHKKGPQPSFDVDKFIENHKSLIKNYYYQKND